MSNKRNYKNIMVAIAFALFISVIGFGVMNIFWMYYKGMYDLPGLYDYNAATIGDGFCLPVLVFAMCLYCMIHKLPDEKERKKINNCSTVIGSAFLIFGVIIQISWLQDDNIGLNWTIPRVHFFNSAGWYHCAYFSFMFGLVAFYLCKVFMIRRKTNRRDYFWDAFLFFLISFGGAFYLMLQRMDDCSANYSHLTILTTVSLALYAVLGVLLFWSNKEYCFADMAPCLSGIVTAYCFAYFVVEPKAIEIHSVVYVVIMFIFSCSCLFVNYNDVQCYFSRLVYICIPICLINLVVLSADYPMYCIFLMIAAVAIPMLNYRGNSISSDLGPESQYDPRKHLFCYQLVIFFSAIAPLYIEFESSYGTFKNFLCNNILIFVACDQIKTIFNKLILIEKKYKNNELQEGKHKTKIQRNITYFSILCVSVGAISFLILTAYDAVHFKLFETSISLKPTQIYGSLALFSLTILCSIVLAMSAKKHNSVYASLILAAAYFFCGMAVYAVKVPFYRGINILCIFALFQAFGGALYIAESYFSNIYRIRGVKYERKYCVNSCIILVGGSAIAWISMLSTADNTGNPSRSVAYLGISVIAYVIAFILLPTVSFVANRPRYFGTEVAPQGAMGEVVKNGIMGVMIAFIAGSIPIYLCSVNDDFWATLFSAITIAHAVFSLASFALKNNVEHLNKRAEECENQRANSTTMAQLAGLEKHLQAQNISVLLSLTPYWVIPLCGMMFTKGKRTLAVVIEECYPKLDKPKQGNIDIDLEVQEKR